MAILITGGSGMIGSLTAVAIARDYGSPVVLYDLFPGQSPPRGGQGLPEIKAVAGDVLDPFRLLQVIRSEGVEAVIHLAGVLANRINAAPYTGVQTNLMGLVNVLEAARVQGLRRVVFASSALVYDFTVPSPGPVREDHPQRPLSVYATSKAAGEWLGLNYATQFGADFVALRFALAFGPGYRYPGAQPNHGARLVKGMIEGALKSRVVTVERPPMSATDWIYAKDLAQGLAQATFATQLQDRAFNLGSGCLRPPDDAIAIVRALFPDIDFRFTPSPLALQMTWPQPLDTGRATAQLGFRPRFSLESALADYVDEIKGAL